MIRYLILLFSICILFPTLLDAHRENLFKDIKFDRISIEEGLSQVTVYSLIQDHRGFIWVGTMDGLNKYDGYTFTIYRHDTFDSTSLSNNRIRVIFEDSRKKLWIGTDNGLNVYDPDKDEFRSILNIPGKHNTISSNLIQAICEDHNGNLWIGTVAGLNRYDPVTGVYKKYLHIESDDLSLADNSVNSLLCDHRNNIWIGTSQGLQMLKNGTGKLHTVSSLPGFSGRDIKTIFEDTDNNLMIGTSSGMAVIDNSGPEITLKTSHSELCNHTATLSVNSFLQDKMLNLWVGTSHGLYLVSQDQKTLTCFMHKAGDPFSLSHDDVQTIFKDHTGNLWIGTYGRGTNKFELRMGHFEGISFSSSQENFVYAINEDPSGNIWVGSNAGVKKFDHEMNLIAQLHHNPANAYSLSDNRVRSLFIDREDFIWVGSYGGIDIYDPKLNKYRNFQHKEGDPYSLSENTVIQIFEDTGGDIWIGTQGGLNLFDRKTEKFYVYQHDPNDPASISENQIRRIFEDHHGNLWIATYGGGLNLFNPANNSFTIFKNNLRDPGSISSNFIYSIFLDSRQNLWIGTYGGGLNRYDYDTGTFENFKKTDGLANDLVYGIMEDINGNIWMSTNRGLSKFFVDSAKNKRRGKTTLFRNYDTGDGLLSNEFNFGAYYKSSNGEMYFGCINGLIFFKPEEIRDNLVPPEIIITDFKISNNKVDVSPEGPMTKHINQADRINLSYMDNVITFEFAGIHYSNPAKNRYAHMLEGVDREWVYTDASRRYATYTTLPGGEYIFRVRAANSDGIWNEKSRDLKIIITPPFWDTWLFRGILSISIIIIILVLTRVRTRQIKLRNKYLESINAELNKNIQHRKKVEYDLQESEEKYRTLTTNLNAGIYRIKPQAKGKFVEVNPALIKIFGYKNKSELLRVPVEQLYQSPLDRKIFVKDINRLGHVENREMVLLKKDGSPVWCSINSVAVKNEAGEIIYHDGLIDDITEKIIMENRIRQTQKMEAIGQLAGGVAHDFNNILTVIQGHAELGMMKADKNDPVYKDLREIHTSGKRAGNLTRQLLAFSRKQPMALQILDINNVITNLEKMVRRLIGEDINIIINLASGLPAINADPGQLEQILLNILINARDAINATNSGNNRTIHIDTQYIEIDKEFVMHHPGSKAGAHILMAISDTGTGMDEKIRAKIFDPFFTTKEPGKGTGLGLATVFGIVKQNNGSIYVVTEPNKGTTFTIYWPAVDQKAPITKVYQNGEKLEGKESILLVEDDDAVRLFTCEILKNLGYHVEQAGQGQAALNLINDKQFKPDLIITDIIMPKMNGRELADKIKAVLPNTKILLMSGYSDNQISLDGKLDKDVNFIAKPFSINKFAKKIREVFSN